MVSTIRFVGITAEVNLLYAGNEAYKRASPSLLLNPGQALPEVLKQRYRWHSKIKIKKKTELSLCFSNIQFPTNYDKKIFERQADINANLNLIY